MGSKRGRPRQNDIPGALAVIDDEVVDGEVVEGEGEVDEIEMFAPSYEPSRGGMRLALVLSDPANLTKTAKELASLAEVCLLHYYRLMADERYQDFLRGVRRQALIQKISAIQDAMVATAREPGRDGYNDRRLIHELLGDIGSGREKEGKDVEITVKYATNWRER